MLSWEQRFSQASGPVRSFRQVVDAPPPTPMSAPFTDGHLAHGGGIRNYPKPRNFNNQPAPLPRDKRRGGKGRIVEPIGPCTRPEGHEWRSKGTDRAGTRLVHCPHCRRATTAKNAGVELPRRKLDRTPIVPIGGEPDCSDAGGHKWHRNGVVRGVKRIVCRWCGVKSRQKEGA